MRLASFFALALLPLVASCGSDTSGGGLLHITLVGDGSFDPSRVARLQVRIDGDGTSSATHDITVRGLGSAATDSYQLMNGPAILVVSAFAFDGAGGKVASGIAPPTSVGNSDASITVTLSTAGDSDGGIPSLGDGGTPGDGSTGNPDFSVGGGCNNCPLGCNMAANRCNRPLPLNGGGPPNEGALGNDVVLSTDTIIDTSSGTTIQNNAPVMLGFSYQKLIQPNGAPPIGVFGARSLKVNSGVTVRLIDAGMMQPGAAALFVTAGDIEIDGRIEAGALDRMGPLPGSGPTPGPGGGAGSGTDGPGRGPQGCGGGSGAPSGNNNIPDDGGGGGGAMAAIGGTGSHGGLAKAGQGGMTIIKSPTPLQGGCGGGSGSNSGGGVRSAGGGGGGALELSAGGNLILGATALIDVGANGGVGGLDISAGGGGGAGGMVILEGVTVTLAQGGFVAANGGGGGAGGNGNGLGAGTAGGPGPAMLAPAVGGASASSGGMGGWENGNAGANAPFNGSANGGGGGGAVGLVVTVANSVKVAPASMSAVYQALAIPMTY
jgi:hypothetical protein